MEDIEYCEYCDAEIDTWDSNNVHATFDGGIMCTECNDKLRKEESDA